MAWITPRSSPALQARVNEWIKKIKGDGRLASLYARYYRNPRFFAERVDSEYSSTSGGKLSIFDDRIKAVAADLHWDWRLLAALVYQESRFNPNARSWAGASGLMQLMPATARAHGVSNLADPEQNLRGGARFLRVLEQRFEFIPEKKERLKFVLASYNAGAGHVEDAQLLARQFGRDPNRWEHHVDEMMLRLADPAYYNSYGLRSGYCRGEEPYNYVREILDRYEQYRKLIPERDSG
ncbi:MAG: transglycosylase SLT domain-containing protein [Leptospirales bacterium]|nr:transglycosylase SLT domain-containing protein [Leptospirales bacterium]